MEVRNINILYSTNDQQTYQDKTIAVHIHVFYLDLIEEFVGYLKNIPLPFDLYLSIPEKQNVDEKQIEKAFRCIENIKDLDIKRTPNRGRDIAPMLCTFKEEILRHDFLLHLHTKKSPHLDNPDEWRIYMLEHLLYSKERTSKILTLLATNSSFVCSPDFFDFTPLNGWTVKENIIEAQKILEKSNLKLDLKREYSSIDFPQGSFFWCRTDSLTELFNLEFKYEDFPEEPIKVDGTLAHALERLFFIWNTNKNTTPVKFFSDKTEVILLSQMNKLQQEKSRIQEKNHKHLKQLRMLIYLCSALLILLIISLFV